MKIIFGQLSLVLLIWAAFYLWPYNVRIVFAFMIHDSNTLKGFQEFLENYYSEQHYYLVHIDKKLQKVDFSQSNVHVVDQQISVKWGKYSLLYSQLLLLKLARDLPFDYFYFLDGMTVPIKPLKELQQFLVKLHPESTAMFNKLPVPPCKINDNACGRTKARCIDEECTKYTITPHGAPVYKSTQWVMLSKPFTDYMFNNPKWFSQWLNFFKHTGVPDESFFQTLLMDSPFNKTQIFQQPMYTKWQYCFKYPKRKGFSPCWLTQADYVDIVTSNQWFARKIEIDNELRTSLYNRL